MPKVSVGRAELDTRTFILYRFYDRTGVLLYVGITVDFRARESNHAKYKAWWPRVDREATVLEHYVGERAARVAETAAIKAEKPLENDQHNEFVEVDDQETTDPLHDFAVNVLSWLAADELNPLLDQAKLDWDDEPLSERDRDIAAAEAAVTLLWRSRRELIRLVGQTVDLLPQGEGEFHRFQAQRQWEIKNDLPVDSVSTSESLTEAFDAEHTLRSILNQKALEVLRSLPVDEAKEWVASARARGITSSPDRLVFAATYIRMVKEAGSGLVGLCQGPGEHGARCPSRTGPTVYFEACGACLGALACSGHRYWCNRHTAAVEAGDLELLRCNPAALWPIKRVEPAEDAAESEPVF